LEIRCRRNDPRVLFKSIPLTHLSSPSFSYLD
jgi:hypothetical protein